MKTGTITSVSSLSEIKPGLHQLEVSMDDFSTYTVFGNMNEYLGYVDKEVEFETREDVINGLVQEVICNVAARSIVQSVDSGDYVDDFEGMTLIPENSKAIDVITFNKDTLKRGDVAKAQVILVSGFKPGKSRVAKWTDFICLDVNSTVFNLRLFTNADDIEDFRNNVVGKYAMVDIKNDDKYGFQVFADMQIYDQEVHIPSEVLLSALKLNIIVRRDEELEGYVKKYDMIDTLKKTIYFEPGYHLVEMAAEIMLIQTVCKIFGEYDRGLLYRCVFASRGYLLGSNAHISNPLVNYHRIITSTLKNDFDLIRLLDITGGLEEGDLNKQVYLSVRRQVTSIMKGRRGINEDNKINSIVADIDTEYGGLLQRGLVGLD
jgi:hypothetical protein